MRENKLIQFYLTNMCNSKCNTCGIWKNANREDLDVQNIIDVISDFPEADYVFGGGEFTLYEYRHELLRYCDRQGISYTILSNCVSLGLLESLVFNYKIKNLTISCDGINHDKIRGIKGNLSDIKTFVNSYRKAIPNLKLSYTLSCFNEGSIDRDIEMFKSMGFDKIYFCIAQNMDLLLASYKKDITPDYESIKYIYETYPYMLYDRDLEYIKRYLSGDVTRCTSTTNVHTIYSNGDVVFCQSHKSDIVLGNIKENSLSNILKENDVDIDIGCMYEKDCALVCQRRYDS